MRNIINGGIIRAMAVSTIVLFVWASDAKASQIYYLGIGNEEFQADITTAYNTMVKYSVIPASISQYFNQTGPQIVTLLNTYRNALVNGDVLIFHYSGHGGAPGIPDAAPIDENNAGNNGNEGVIGLSDAGSPGTFTVPNIGIRSSRDDAIAAEINSFRQSVGVLAIFDNCFSGEMIDGTSDISRGLIIGTSDADHCAPGASLFMPYFNDAFTVVGGNFKADTNKDGLMTLGELYTALAQINGVANGEGGTGYARNFNEPAAHLLYGVATVPEPPAILLCGAGFVAIAVAWRRLRRFQS